MRRLFFRIGASGMMFMLSASAAPACLNDSEVKNAEREFKSQYQLNTEYRKRTIEEPSSQEGPVSPVAAFSLGSFLLVGALVVCLRKPS